MRCERASKRAPHNSAPQPPCPPPCIHPLNAPHTPPRPAPPHPPVAVSLLEGPMMRVTQAGTYTTLRGTPRSTAVAAGLGGSMLSGEAAYGWEQVGGG